MLYSFHRLRTKQPRADQEAQTQTQRRLEQANSLIGQLHHLVFCEYDQPGQLDIILLLWFSQGIYDI